MVKESSPQPRMYNMHTHCFTIDHAPDYFARGYTWFPIRISTIRRHGLIAWCIKNLPKLFKGEGLERLINLVRYMDRDDQEKILKLLMSYYPARTAFGVLAMDMEYMQAEAPVEKYKLQLGKLAVMKSKPDYKDILYPFICVDPRRIEPKVNTWESKVEQSFIGQSFLSTIREYIEQDIFQGIKLYPALGYFPFDKRLKPVYDLALKYNLPIVSHVINGVVHFRGEKEYHEHPYTGKPLPGKKPKEFCAHFTHPLNFEILLNPEHLSKYWNIPLEEAKPYQNLKICLGHFGGDEAMVEYLNNPWLPDNSKPFESLSLGRWKPGDDENNFSWFSICCDLMRKYPNVYADISYTASNPVVFPLLKVILESDEVIRNKTLFGSDFYVVTKALSERAFAINVRAALGESLFRKIAYENPEVFFKKEKVPA